MTKSDFFDELCILWPVLSKAFKAFVKVLDLYSDNDLQTIYDYVYNHGIKFTPKPWDIKNIAENCGIHKGYKIENSYWYYKCPYCKAKFTINSGGCPKCHKPFGKLNIEHVVKTNFLKSDVFVVKNDCWKCPEYKKDSRVCVGTSCDEWGNRKRFSEVCKTCACLNCCNDEIKNRLELKER